MLKLLLPLQTLAATNVLIAAYFGGSAQKSMLNLAKELLGAVNNQNEPKFNVTLLVNIDTPNLLDHQ